ncbi:MAG: folylpolyglutamate synthase/dihydrofolate synthase family protein [Pseudomonadota bacterium]
MSLHPKLIDLTLNRVWSLLEKFENPQASLPNVIHIAGTNGKGSVLSYLRAGLETADFKVNAYTSPHLTCFHERIRMGGDLISEEALAEVLAECETANGDEPITYFEITTVAALLAFSRSAADYTLLEVGLGGRLDATNVIDAPAMTMITPVSMDHEQFLGSTLAAIAGEKAGILKSGCFAVIGPQEDEALEVIEAKAWEVGATLKCHGQHWHVWEEQGRLVFQDEYGLVEVPLPRLAGAHQLQNAGMAIAALRLLGAPEVALSGATENVQWPARLQRLKTGPLVDAAQGSELWLDGGHNPSAGTALADYLRSLPEAPTVLITGMLNTKDAIGYLTPLAEVASHAFTVAIPGEKASLSADDLAGIATGIGMESEASKTVEDAIRKITRAIPGARIVICGSLYLAGHILRENG